MNLLDWTTWPDWVWEIWTTLMLIGGILWIAWAALIGRRRCRFPLQPSGDPCPNPRPCKIHGTRAAGLLLAVVLAGMLSGCSTCHDGYNHHWILGVPVDSEYSPCRMGCCKEIKPKNCGCTKSCPCWDKHGTPQNGG